MKLRINKLEILYPNGEKQRGSVDCSDTVVSTVLNLICKIYENVYLHYSENAVRNQFKWLFLSNLCLRGSFCIVAVCDLVPDLETIFHFRKLLKTSGNRIDLKLKTANSRTSPFFFRKDFHMLEAVNIEHVHVQPPHRALGNTLHQNQSSH